MHGRRDWLGPGGRPQPRRLDRLRWDLEDLDGRLRDAVADAVGSALGGLVRDAARRGLDRLAGRRTHLEPRPLRLPGRLGDGRGRLDEDDRRPGQGLWAEGGGWDDEPEPYDEPPRDEEAAVTPGSASAGRLALTASAGLQAAAWWLGRGAGRRPGLAALALALLVGGLAYAAPRLAAAAFGLAGAAGQLGLLQGLSRADEETPLDDD
jgi:hypothetical protein